MNNLFLPLYENLTELPTFSVSFGNKFPSLPESSGIYIIWGGRDFSLENVPTNKVIYVGQAESLKNRLSLKKHHILKPLKKHCSGFNISIIECEDYLLDDLERLAIRFYQPLLNLVWNQTDSKTAASREQFYKLVVTGESEFTSELHEGLGSSISNDYFLLFKTFRLLEQKKEIATANLRLLTCELEDVESKLLEAQIFSYKSQVKELESRYSKLEAENKELKSKLANVGASAYPELADL